MHRTAPDRLRRLVPVLAGLVVLAGLLAAPAVHATSAARPAMDFRDATRFQLFYVYAADRAPVAARPAAIQHIAAQVDTWLAAQIGGGLSPRFVTGADGRPTVLSIRSSLKSSVLNKREDISYDAMPSYVARGLVKSKVLPIFMIEGEQDYDACAWYWDGDNGPYISFPLANCDIIPTVDDDFPDYGSYTLAHEIVHALGAVDDRAPHEDGTSHIKGDPQDLMMGGEWDEVDWDNLTLDPGHDDYLRTGRSDLVNIETSALLERSTARR
ncbi:MAG: hypothetical protein PHU75_07760 [Candidatus Nanopelagicales bacterium]|nr:hypothetical protein [Candidatus Nanopelagicales bacterium]